MSSRQNPFLFEHQWTIYNVHNLLTGQSLSTLHSICFPAECIEFQFSLRLLPNYVQKDNNRSFVSIFLHLEDCAENVSFNTRYRITVFGQDYAKEGTSVFTKGNCHGFTAFIPMTTLEKMLKKLNDSLSIICQIEIENYQQISSLKILCPNSSSALIVNPTVIKFPCKWICNDFSLWYYKNWYNDNVSLKLKKFSVPENEDLSFYLVLVMKKDHNNVKGSACKKSIALFLYFESEKVKEVMVHYRMSVLNWKGKSCVSGEGQGRMYSKGDGRGATNFISCDDLMDLRRGLLPMDRLTVVAQIEIFEIDNTLDNSFYTIQRSYYPKVNIKLLFQRVLFQVLEVSAMQLISYCRQYNWKNSLVTIRGPVQMRDFQSHVLQSSSQHHDVHVRTQSFKELYQKGAYFEHKFIIENYGYFYIDDHQSPTMIQSDTFSLYRDKCDAQFCLRLYPKGVNSTTKFISIFVHLLAGPAVVHIECKLSIIDFRYKVCNTKSIKGLLTKDNQLGFDDFVTNDCTVLNRHGYLPGKLTVLCEIEILDWSTNYESFSVASTFRNLTNESSIAKSLSVWDASEYVLKHELQWKIPQYKFIHQHNICASSDSFEIENLDSLQLGLKLFPKGQTKKGNHLSLLMNLSDGEAKKVKVLSRLSIRDYQNKLRNSRWIYGMLIAPKGLDCDRFIENDYLFEQENELLPENNLTINCEIEVLRKLEYEGADSITVMESQVSSNHLVMDSIQSMNVTNSIMIFDSQCTFGGNISLSYND